MLDHDEEQAVLAAFRRAVERITSRTGGPRGMRLAEAGDALTDIENVARRLAPRDPDAMLIIGHCADLRELIAKL